MENQLRIYVAEDLELIRNIYNRRLKDVYDLSVFSDGESLLDAMNRNNHPDLIITDNYMNRITGHELISVKLPELGYQGKVLMVSGQIPRNATYNTLEKPFRIDKLKIIIAELLSG